MGNNKKATGLCKEQHSSLPKQNELIFFTLIGQGYQMYKFKKKQKNTEKMRFYTKDHKKTICQWIKKDTTLTKAIFKWMKILKVKVMVKFKVIKCRIWKFVKTRISHVLDQYLDG